MFKVTAQEKNWILYDVANSAFILLASTIIPIYFESIASKEQISSVTYLAYWGYATSISTVLVALAGPLIGAMGDRKEKKRKLLGLMVILGALGCMILGTIHSWILFLLLFILTKSVYSISLIYYDSMLVDVTEKKRMDRISAHGFAWGYIGSCIPFIAGLLLIFGQERIGLSMEMAFETAFFITGAWWLLFTLPLFCSYQQKQFSKAENLKKNPVREVAATLHKIRRKRKILLFLIAYFFYIDGVYTIIDMSTIYGKALGLGNTTLLLALLLTQIIAFPCAIGVARLSAKFECSRLISICILAYLGISIFAIFMNQEIEFWILAVLVGMFQGGIQALSRSYYAKIIPKGKSSEYYGILDICGKGASFLGVTLISVVTQITGSTTKGISVIAVMMMAGFFFFQMATRKDQGRYDLEIWEQVEMREAHL